MSAKSSVMRGPKDILTKTVAVARTNTTAFVGCTLPKGSRLVGFVLVGTASNAGTSATISIGTSSTSTELVAAHDVKTAASGNGPVLLASVAGTHGVVYTTDKPIYFKYAESGTASSAGAWIVEVLHTTGNGINDSSL